MPYLHVPGDGEVGDERMLGGKGATLCALTRDGFPVPRFFCVTTRLLREIRRGEGDDLRAGLRRLAELPVGDAAAAELAREVSEVARVTIRGRGLEPSVRDAVEATLARSFEPDVRVAIRSSVVGEDSARSSFAGQMDTYLYVGPEDVPARILDCLASAFSERALLYRHARAMMERPIEVGAVVQAMVPAWRSGVAFTADPVTGDPSVVVVTAGFGLGEGIVGELVETDTFRVDKEERCVRRREIVCKEHRVVRDRVRGRGSRVTSVPEELREKPVLSDAELREVVDLAARLERWSGAPCDVEWSLEPGGSLKLLQSRPVTALSTDRLTILDNSNIVESYPGVSSPLTFTFVRHGYAETFREAMRTFGVSEAVLDRERNLFENLVAYVDGRIYYNILHWYRLYELMGLEGGIPAWERALGLSRGARPEPRSEGPGLWRRTYIRARLATNLFARRGRIADYLDALRAEEAQLRELDLEAESAHELLELLEGAMDRLLAPYGIAVVNDLYAQQLFGLVGRLIERWKLGDPDSLRNALLVGGAPSDSVLAVRSLTTLADEVRTRAPWRELFEAESDPEALREELRRRPDLADLRQRFERHLALYGDRTVHELKLETPSLRDDPAFALSLLRSYVLAPAADRRSDSERLRREAEKRVRQRLRFHPVRRLVFSRTLRWAREALRHRENMRLARTRAFGLVKRIFRALARRFSENGFLGEPEEIFFLTLEEVRGVVRGSSVTADLRRLASIRRDELARHERTELPPRIVVRGPVLGVSTSPALPEASGPPAAERPGTRLRGEGCSRGVVRGRALVVREPRRQVDVEDRILVAPMTDPGWVFLMVAARGLVVEKGSPLSHTAIVGRELGIPTVVAVAGATSRIGDGDLIEIDGTVGTVRILERAAAGDASSGAPPSG